jgi:hypothetical protein
LTASTSKHAWRTSSGRSATCWRPRPAARDFGEELKALLQEALQLWHAYREGMAPNFLTEAKAVQEEMTYQLRDRRLKDANHQRLLDALGWHHDQGIGCAAW